MKLKLLEHLRMNQPTLIATFGQAQIVRHLNGRYELRGGTPDDHTAAGALIDDSEPRASPPELPRRDSFRSNEGRPRAEAAHRFMRRA